MDIPPPTIQYEIRGTVFKPNDEDSLDLKVCYQEEWEVCGITGLRFSPDDPTTWVNGFDFEAPIPESDFVISGEAWDEIGVGGTISYVTPDVTVSAGLTPLTNSVNAIDQGLYQTKLAVNYTTDIDDFTLRGELSNAWVSDGNSVINFQNSLAYTWNGGITEFNLQVRSAAFNSNAYWSPELLVRPVLIHRVAFPLSDNLTLGLGGGFGYQWGDDEEWTFPIGLGLRWDVHETLNCTFDARAGYGATIRLMCNQLLR